MPNHAENKTSKDPLVLQQKNSLLLPHAGHFGAVQRPLHCHHHCSSFPVEVFFCHPWTITQRHLYLKRYESLAPSRLDYLHLECFPSLEMSKGPRNVHPEQEASKYQFETVVEQEFSLEQRKTVTDRWLNTYRYVVNSIIQNMPSTKLTPPFEGKENH